jgi:hypothetical protein
MVQPRHSKQNKGANPDGARSNSNEEEAVKRTIINDEMIRGATTSYINK